jgi:hypothetical protein
MTETESVYCAVRAESLNKIHINLSPETVNSVICSIFISRHLSFGPSAHLNEAVLRATLATSVVDTL